MRFMRLHRCAWKADVALFLTLSLLFGPALMGLEGKWQSTASQAAAQAPVAPAVAVRPILVVPFTAAEEAAQKAPIDLAAQFTLSLTLELEKSGRVAPTRLSLDEPTIARLIQEKSLTEETVLNVLQQPTPEGIAEIATAMKIPEAIFGEVESYEYVANKGGKVTVKVTAHFLTIDLQTGAIVKTDDITHEGIGVPKVGEAADEKFLAIKAVGDAAQKIVAEFLGIKPPPPPRPPRPALETALPILLGLLVLGAALGGRARKAPAVPPPVGPAGAPRSVTAVPQGNQIIITWQPPDQGTPIGYHVYRGDAGSAPTARQAGRQFSRLTVTPVSGTQFTDTTAVPGRLYIYAVTAVYAGDRESPQALANEFIPGQPAAVGIGVPLPPRNLQAEPREGAVVLTWQESNPPGFVRGYRVYRQAGAPPSDANLVADETIVRTTTFIDRGLQNGVTYFYVVRAVSVQNFLSVPSNVATATPGDFIPLNPTNLVARFDPNTFTVTLNWSAPPDPDIDHYEVARVSTQEIRGRALGSRLTREAPVINLPPGIARAVAERMKAGMRQAAGNEFEQNIIANNIRATTFIDNVAQFRPGPVPGATSYTRLRYAVRAVDRTGNKSNWSNVAEVLPNTPPPSLRTQRPRLVPGSGQVVVDLLAILTAARNDPQAGVEWQSDAKGVRIFRSTTKGGTQAATLPPIHAVDPLPLEQLDQGRFFKDTAVTNGVRYFYAVELVDKQNISGERSQEAVATPFASATIGIVAQDLTTRALRTELSGNGQDSVQIVFSVLDERSRPIAGFPLLISLTGVGTLTIDPAFRDPDVQGGALTDENGQVLATYQAGAVTTDTTVTISAAPGGGITGVEPKQLTLTVRAPRLASVEVRPQKNQLTADGLDFTEVTITVRDTLGQPMPDKIIQLSISPAGQGRFEDLTGNPITQIRTGTAAADLGVARVRYRSGTRTGSVTLSASVTEGTITIAGQAVVTLVSGTPATIELVAVPTTAPADGATEIRVTATVKDAQGNAVPRVQVRFSATPTLTINPSTATTDDTGQATVLVIAPRVAGSYLVRAEVGTIANTIGLTFTASAPTTLTLSASRTDLVVSLPPNYGRQDYANLLPLSRTEITATVLDENSNPIPNIVVQFQTNAGTIQATAITDAAGVARALFLAPQRLIGQVTINAQAGAAAGSINLNIVPGPAAKVQISAAPLVLPADGRSQSQLTAEVFDANENRVADGTLVNFQLSPANAGQLLRSQVPTTNGTATTSYIATADATISQVTVTAIASSVVFGQSFTTDPNDPFSKATVTITLGVQVQIDRPSFIPEIAVSSSDGTTNPADRRSLRSRPPVNNFTDMLIKLVDGRGNPVPRSGVDVTVATSDSRVLIENQATNDRSLGLLIARTDTNGQVRLRLYASTIAGVVSVAAELRDQQGNLFSSDTVNITQRPGDPAQITMPTPQPNIIFVPGAGTPTQTGITAQVRDAANNLVEAGIPVTFDATMAGARVGTLTPSSATTDANGAAATTLTSSLDTGIVTVTAQTTPAAQQPGSTTVAFVTGVTAISVTATNSQIGGTPTDNIPDSTPVTATFTGVIPNNTKVTFTTTRGTFDPTSPTPIRSRTVAVTDNTAQVTLHSEVVSLDTPATVSVTVLGPNGQPVTGSVTVMIVPAPQPIELQPIEVAQANLVVSNTNSTTPTARQPLDPALPNSTTVTVSVREQNTNKPIQGAVVTLRSDDPNTLWVVGNTARLTTIQVTTDANGQGQATFYASMKAGDVTITAEFDPGTGVQRKTATITQVPGPALLTVATNFASVFVRLPDTFTTADGQAHDYRSLPGNSGNKAQVIATVADANKNPYPNIPVTFTATDGVIAQSATTGSDGKATVDYAPPVQIPSGGQVTVTAQATVGSQSLSGQVTLQVRSGPPAVVQIASNPTDLPADGTSTASVTATIGDANGNAVRDGVSVTLRLTSRPAADTKWLPSGTDTITLSTINGQVTATLAAGLKAGVAAVRATASETVSPTTFSASNVPDLTIPIGAQLQPIQLDQTQVFVSADDQGNRFPPRDGFTYDNDAVVKVKVQTPAGQGVENATVVLTSSDANTLWRVNGQITKRTTQVLTDPNGEAQATFLASQKAGTVTITASVGAQSQQATIVQQVGPPIVKITANPKEIFVQMVGSQYAILPQQSQVIVSVTDPNNNPHPNAAVQLSASAGTLSATSGQTGANGQFVATLTAPNQPAQITLRVDSAITERGERPDPADTRNKFTETVAVNPGPPALLALSADRLVVQANQSATITARVQDPNGNPVRDGISVTFRLTAAPTGTSINPTSGTTTNGQVQTTLTAGNVAGTATIEAEAVDVVVGQFFRATNRLNIAVGVTVVLQQLEIVTKTLVVSDTNATDPALRKPLDPNKENKTVVRAKVSGTAGLPIPVILDSSDDKSLWVDRRDPSRRALKQITLTVDANGEAEAIFYASTTRALPANPVTIRASLDPTFPPAQTLSDTIVQEPGPPAQVVLALTGFGRAADGTPYLTIPTTGTVSGTFTATVTDANNNGIPNTTVNFALSPDLPGTDEGTLSATQQTTDTDGKTPTVTLTASNFTTEVTLTATANGASASQKIRYSVSLTGVNIVGNPSQIPDDGTTTSTISVTGTPAFRQGLKFRLAADLGSTLTADGTADVASLTVEVGNNNPAGEGTNEARAILKGPQPDLSQTVNRTITLTASLIVDGTPRDFTGTITLIPRIQVTSNFGLSNEPNRLVVSSTNDLDPTNRIALDGVIGHNKATLRVIVNGAAAPTPRLVTFSSTDGAVLFDKKADGVNPASRQLGNISGNLVQVGTQWIYEVDLYSSTVALPSVTVNIGVLGVSRSIVFEQVPGLPAQVIVSPSRPVIGVTGHPSLPTSTNVQAIVRDAAGNLLTTPGITVFFTADAGTLDPASAPAINGVAQTTITSTNETRRVRVFARAVAPTGAEAVGVSSVIFAVGQVNIVELRTDRAADPQGNVPVPAGEIVRVTAVFSPSGSVPDNVRVQASLVGAYGVIQTISPTSNNQAEIVIFNNNTNDADSSSRTKVFVYEQSGNLIASPELTLIMKGVTTPPALSLASDLGSDTTRDGIPDSNPLVVSDEDSTNKTLRDALLPHAGGPSVNVTTLLLTTRNLSAGQQVQFQLRATDPNGLFVFPTTATTGNLGEVTFTVTDGGANDTDGVANGTIATKAEYYSSRKAQIVIVSAEVRKNAPAFDQLHGRASITVVQEAGRVEQSFFTVDPPRLAVNTLLGREPVEARLIATLLDANDNPVPNERVSFAIEPIEVVPYADISAGNAFNVILTRYDLRSLTQVFDPNVASPRRFYQNLTGTIFQIFLSPDPADGVEDEFTGSTMPRLPRPGTVTVYATIGGRDVTARDDGNGNITGPYVEDGTVDYDTGDISVDYEDTNVPDKGTRVRVTFQSTEFTGRLAQVPVRPSTIIVQTTIDNNIELLWDTGGGTIRGNRGTGTIDYNTGDISVIFDMPPDAGALVTVSYESVRFPNAWGSGGLPFGFAFIGYRKFVPPGAVTDPALEAPPNTSPLVSDGSIFPQSEGITDTNGVAVTFFRSFNVSQPVLLKMVPESRKDLLRRFDTFYYVPVQQVQLSILQGGLVNPPGSTFTVEFRFFPAGSLPVGSRIWVRVHGFAYDWDEDGDNKFNEDPPGTINPDDDFDGRVEEDPNEPQNAVDNDGDGQQGEDPPGAVPGAGGRVLSDDDGDGLADEDFNPGWYDNWFTITVTEPDVIRYSITNGTTGPDWVDGWKVIQIFFWNRDGIRMMAQTSAIEFRY